MKNTLLFLFSILFWLESCANDISLTKISVNTDKPKYRIGDKITINWKNETAKVGDCILIAPSASEPDTTSTFVKKISAGAKKGSVFYKAAIADHNYVARYFIGCDMDEADYRESKPFDVLYE